MFIYDLLKAYGTFPPRFVLRVFSTEADNDGELNPCHFLDFIQKDAAYWQIRAFIRSSKRLEQAVMNLLRLFFVQDMHQAKKKSISGADVILYSKKKSKTADYEIKKKYINL